MSVSLKTIAVTLAGVSALTSAPCPASVLTPTDKTAVSIGSPIDLVHYGWTGHRRHQQYYARGCNSSWSGCSSASNYPVYTYENPYGPYWYLARSAAGWGDGF